MAKRYSPTAEEADRLAIQNPDWPWEQCWEIAKEIYGE